MTPQRPILLGIVGDSATGKSTISNGLRQILGTGKVTHVCTDDYHKYDRQERAALGITPLNPECNYIDVLEQHIQRLRYGQPILKPVYDHSTGTLIRPEYVTPSQFVIVEGLLGFSTPALRHFYDVKVFLNPQEEMRRLWKIKRDTSRRGYTRDQVLEELERRELDSLKYIHPQRTFADIVVSFYPPPGASPDLPGAMLNVRLVLRPTIPHPDLTYLLETQDACDSGVRLILGRDSGRPVDFLDIDGDVATQHVAQLEEVIWQMLPDLRPVDDDLFDVYQDRHEVRHSPPLAITHLLIAYHLLLKSRDLCQKEPPRKTMPTQVLDLI